MGVNKQFRRTLISAAFTLGFTAAGTAYATNWLMLQGTEPAAASSPVKVWGFIQTYYQKDYSSASATGAYVPSKLLGPNLNAQSAINISHAQIGVRGTGFPIDGNINYMLLLEAGNAGTNMGSAGNNGAVVTDASVTLNHIKGARIRTGLFKYPGSEEGLQSLTTMDYVNFTEAANFLLLERFPNAAYTANVGPYTQAQLQNGSNINGFTAPAGGFRDTGVQVFDSFDMGKDWNLSYAAMAGQGSGVQFDNADGSFDKYLYLSTEKNHASTGPANGLKFFAWSQSGKRLADVTNDSVANRKLYDRKRSGLGAKYMARPYRATFEYISADGMIFEGPDKPSYYFANAANATGTNNGADAKAKGWYLDGGWYIPDTKWELDARYDIMDANTGRNDEHRFGKWTFGTQYLFNPMSKITVNYEKRHYKCTTSTTQCTNANLNLNGVGNRFSVQVTAAF
ncbi:MAG: OprO/OprP family phosphate-selective porin [Gallionella sp.]|nr:OprO/OprP family phosphate-selective porin [Gallionella sp.]